MKLWIDDIRDAPEGWTLARSISEAVTFISMYAPQITHISLDHDISIEVRVGGKKYNRPSPDTFKVVALFCVALALSFKEDIKFTTHSSNHVGRQAIKDILIAAAWPCEETPLDKVRRT